MLLSFRKQVDLGSEELFPLRTFNEYELLQAAWAEKTRGNNSSLYIIINIIHYTYRPYG